MAIGRGDAGAGVENLRRCLQQLQAMRYEMLNTGFKLSLVQGLMATGQFDEGMTLVDETIGLVEANGDLCSHAGSAACEGKRSSLDAAAPGA